MSYEIAPLGQFERPVATNVRWTLADMLLLAAATLGVGALLVLAFGVIASADGGALAGLISERPLAAGMVVGGLVYGLAVLMAYLLIVGRGRASWAELGLRRPPLLPMLMVPLIFAAQMTSMVVINLTLFAIRGEFENPQVGALTDPRGFSWLNFAIVFLVGAILAPIAEELLFRGLLYQWLRARTGVLLAVIGSAVIFSVAHRIVLLFPALFAVGVILALAFEWSRSLWVTIALHMMQNALAIGVLFFVQANPQLIERLS